MNTITKLSITWFIAAALVAVASPAFAQADDEDLKFAAIEALITAPPERAMPIVQRVLASDASDELKTVTWIGVALCVAGGGWLAAKPALLSGIVAGVALSILGVIDALVAVDSGGLGFIAPLIDFAFAVKVFINCAQYAKAASQPVTEIGPPPM